MHRLLLYLLLLVCLEGYANRDSIIIRGDVVDEQGIGITHYYVKVTSASTGLILAYVNSGSSNTFSCKVHTSPSDSLVISVSHIAYRQASITQSFAQLKSGNRISFQLINAPAQLDTVRVKAPEKWVRGDTTFYRVEAFKDGNEVKLRDLVGKLPDFSFDEDGRLMYKRRVVAKILIDGQEIFADKLDVLLSNFPVHVLSTVQAIENQSDKKLLRGLVSHGQVYINLGLNKAKIKTAFGDGEAGIGTHSRYKFNPVMFSVAGKLKAGIIANWNSIGNGLSNNYYRELYKPAEYEGQTLLLRNQPLLLINNFETRWYIRNQQWDNRLQFNLPLGKNIKSQTEVVYLRDRQSQSTFYNSLINTSSGTVARHETNQVLYKPVLFNVRERIDWEIDTTTSLRAEGNVFYDGGRGWQQSVYNFAGSTLPFSTYTGNNWWSGNVRVDVTKRLSATKALESYLVLNRQQLSQSSAAQSETYPAIYQIPGEFININFNPGHQLSVAEGGVNFTNKRKGRVIFSGIRVRHHSLQLFNESFFSDSSFNKTQPALTHWGVQNFSAELFHKQSVRLLLKSPFYVDASAGLNHLNSNGIYNSVIGSLAVSHKHDIKNVNANLDVRLNRKPQEIARWITTPFPTTANTFRYTAGNPEPINSLGVLYGFTFLLPDKMSSAYLSLQGNRHFNSIVSFVQLADVVQYRRDSVINRGANRWSVNFSTEVPSLLIMAKLSLNASYFNSEYYIFQNGAIDKLNLGFTSIKLGFKKNFRKKYFWNGSANFIYNTYRSHNPGGNVIPANMMLHFTIEQRYVLNNKISLASTSSLFNNDVINNRSGTFLFSDCELQYVLAGSSSFLSLRVENIFDQKNYNSFSNTALLQSHFQTPLVPRSVYAGFKLQF